MDIFQVCDQHPRNKAGIKAPSLPNLTGQSLIPFHRDEKIVCLRIEKFVQEWTFSFSNVSNINYLTLSQSVHPLINFSDLNSYFTEISLQTCILVEKNVTKRF